MSSAGRARRVPWRGGRPGDPSPREAALAGALLRHRPIRPRGPTGAARRQVRRPGSGGPAAEGAGAPPLRPAPTVWTPVGKAAAPEGCGPRSGESGRPEGVPHASGTGRSTPHTAGPACSLSERARGAMPVLAASVRPLPPPCPFACTEIGAQRG